MSSAISFTASRKAFLSLLPNSKSKLFKKLEDVFTLIAGGDLEAFFLHLLSKTKIGKDYLIPAATKLLMDPVMNSISMLYQNTPENKKIHVLSLVAFHKPALLEAYGFVFSQGQLERARNLEKSGKATLMSYKREVPPSKKQTSGSHIEKIVETLLKNSNISSYTKKRKELNKEKNKNQKKKIKKKIDYEIKNKEYKKELIYIMNFCKSDMYLKYKKENVISVSKSTFLKYIPENFIKAKKKTDMCPLCVNEKRITKIIETQNQNQANIIDQNLKSKVKTSQNSQNNVLASSKKRKISDFFEVISNHDSGKNMKKKKITISKNTISLEKKLEALKQHKNTVNHQQYSFDKQIYDLHEDECIIVIDFKENLRIGGGPVETKAQFFEQSFVSDLGAAVLTKKRQKNKISYYNFFSEILSHDSKFSGDCITQLLKRDEMKSFKKVSIWSDGGKHFKSKEFLATIFENIHKTNKINIEMNYFAEYHGKGIVDGHFGTISKWLKECMSTKNILTINDIIESFSEKEILRQMTKKIKDGKEVEKSKFYFLEYKRDKRSKIIKLEFLNIKNYLSFFMKNQILYASYFTHQEKGIYSKIRYEKSIKDDLRPTKMSIPNKINSQINDSFIMGNNTFELQMARKNKMSEFGIPMEP